jgi:hypothetical protein
MFWFFLLLTLSVILFAELYPIRKLKMNPCGEPEKPKNPKGESFVLHLHTVYSYDSLGKPQEIERAAKTLGVNKVFTTDHENDLIGKCHQSEIIVGGVETDHPEYGRILKIDETIILTHPDNPKYPWRGKFKRGFYYEIINLKDAIKRAPLWLKAYFIARSLLLYPLSREAALKFFPKLIPLGRWIGLYLERTGGTLPIVGGLDHHVKLTLWEKPKKSFSFPPYRDSFFILQNKTFGEEAENALRTGRFYLSLCGETLEVERNRVLIESKALFFNYKSDEVSVNTCGELEEGTLLVAVYRYLFGVGNYYFGLRPAALFIPPDRVSQILSENK